MQSSSFSFDFKIPPHAICGIQLNKNDVLKYSKAISQTEFTAECSINEKQNNLYITKKLHKLLVQKQLHRHTSHSDY